MKRSVKINAWKRCKRHFTPGFYQDLVQRVVNTIDIASFFKFRWLPFYQHELLKRFPKVFLTVEGDHWMSTSSLIRWSMSSPLSFNSKLSKQSMESGVLVQCPEPFFVFAFVKP